MNVSSMFCWSSKSVENSRHTSRHLRSRDGGHHGNRVFPKLYCTAPSILYSFFQFSLRILFLTAVPLVAAQQLQLVDRNKALCALVSSTNIAGLGSSWLCDSLGAPVDDPCLWLGVLCDTNQGVISLELPFEALSGKFIVKLLLSSMH
jgi:hypothetical protein